MGLCLLPHRKLRNLCNLGWSEAAPALGQALPQHLLASLGNGFVPQFPCSCSRVFLQTSISGQIAPKMGLTASWWLCPCPGYVAVCLAIASCCEGQGLRALFRVPVRRISAGIFLQRGPGCIGAMKNRLWKPARGEPQGVVGKI